MDLNKENIKKIRGLIIFTIIALVVGVNYKSIFELAGTGLRMMLPFLLGAAIAFILNVPMRKIETSLMPRKESKLKRPISLVLTIIFVLCIMLIVIFVVVPELLKTLLSLQESIAAFGLQMQKEAEAVFAKYPEIVNYINSIQIDWKSLLEGILGFLTNGAGSVLSTTVSAAVSIVNGFTTFGIGFIFSIYILLQKEVLSGQMKKLLRAFLPAKVSESVLEISVLTEKTFSNFLAGQCLEAVILGTMFFITLTILKMPYALLIGVLISFTALIPIFGAFIGCAVGAFLMLISNPVSALTFIIIFFVLQQIEGNLIYPHVVGNSVGLPSIWVLVAVTLGGSAFGIVGMLVFIPLCSVMYTLLRGTVNDRLRRRIPAKKTGK